MTVFTLNFYDVFRRKLGKYNVLGVKIARRALKIYVIRRTIEQSHA